MSKNFSKGRASYALASEKYINALLNDKLKDSEMYKATLNESWIKSSDQQFKHISTFLKVRGLILKDSKWVAKNRIDKKFKKSDLLLTLKNGNQIGVSLKKNNHCVFHNQRIGVKEAENSVILNNYLKRSEKLLLEYSGEDLRGISKEKRKKRKKVYESMALKNPKIINSTLQAHNELKQKMLEETCTEETENQIKKEVQLFIKNIAEGNLIVVWGGDRKNPEGGILSNNEIGKEFAKNKTKILVSKKFNKKIVSIGGIEIGVLKIREDGIGYGHTFREDVVLAQEALNSLKNLKK
jgi:hypothetical protein